MEKDYLDFILTMEKEWPADRLRQFTLDYLRENCKWALDKRASLESENKEARARGISYSERKKFTVKINALDSLFLKWRNRGIYYDRHPIKLNELVQPEDLEYIHRRGLEKFIQSAVSW